MSIINYVQAYEIDGKVFATIQAAEAYQARQRLDARLEEGCVGCGCSWDAAMFRDWMVEQGHYLVELLTMIERGDL